MNKSIFITATDTGVGKTTISAALASLLKTKGYKVGYFKPVETGCDPDCSDARTLASIIDQPLDEIVLYRFKTPVAPFVAEKIENQKIDISRIYSHLKKLQEKYDYLIVEGAGGIYVPITEENGKILTYLDFIQEIQIPVLLVSRASLGTINHTVLTVQALKKINAEIKAIVMTGFTGKDPGEHFNPEIVSTMTGIKQIIKCNYSEYPVYECLNKIGKIENEI